MLVASNDTCAPSIRIKTHIHSITNQHLYTMQTHFASKVCEDYIPSTELHSKKGVRQRLFDDTLDNLLIGHMICASESTSYEYSRQLPAIDPLSGP